MCEFCANHESAYSVYMRGHVNTVYACRTLCLYNCGGGGGGGGGRRGFRRENTKCNRLQARRYRDAIQYIFTLVAHE